MRQSNPSRRTRVRAIAPGSYSCRRVVHRSPTLSTSCSGGEISSC